MKKKVTAIFIIVCLLYNSNAFAQQDPLYAQYLFNTTIINPAYPIMDDAVNINMTLRNQWAGLDGAPKTGALTVGAPINASGTNIGGIIFYDKIGNIIQTGPAFNVSQKVTIGEETYLGLGLRIGQSFYREDNSIFNSTDPLYSDNRKYSRTDVGIGFIISAPNFFIGLSAPTIQSLAVAENKQYIMKRKPTYYLHSGYTMEVNEQVVLEPNALIRYTPGSPMQADINMSAMLKETLWIGASWRSSKTIVGVAKLQVAKFLQIGYSYDYSYGQTLSQIPSSANEIFVGFRFGGNSDKKRWDY